MQWKVRPALATDAEAIRDVATSAWRDTYRELLAPATIEAFIDRAYSIERLERRIARHVFLVVEGDSSVVAFAEGVEEPDRLNLASIYALPEAQGRGVGSLLLENLRAHFPGQPVSADVLIGNRKGEVFYERRGFVPRETLQSELFGEPVVERRWWLAVSVVVPDPDRLGPGSSPGGDTALGGTAAGGVGLCIGIAVDGAHQLLYAWDPFGRQQVRVDLATGQITGRGALPAAASTDPLSTAARILARWVPALRNRHRSHGP